VDQAGLVRVAAQLDSFVGEVFSSLVRKDRQAEAGLYVRGLMLEGRLRVNHQRLQQFVTSSPWDVEPVRKTLARKACTLIKPDAWVIDNTGFVKDGDASRAWPANTRAPWAKSATVRSR
jgi:SRSO17 transposase